MLIMGPRNSSKGVLQTTLINAFGTTLVKSTNLGNFETSCYMPAVTSYIIHHNVHRHAYNAGQGCS